LFVQKARLYSADVKQHKQMARQKLHSYSPEKQAGAIGAKKPSSLPHNQTVLQAPIATKNKNLTNRFNLLLISEIPASALHAKYNREDS
jgi:hypothetical protein